MGSDASNQIWYVQLACLYSTSSSSHILNKDDDEKYYSKQERGDG